MTFIQKGTKEYKQASAALFIGGFVTFAVLYTTQPLLPVIAKEFQISAASSSLSLSVTTGILAFAILFSAGLSDSFGKKKIMTISLFITSVLGFLTALSPNFSSLLAVRALMGIFIAGVPSIAMAYVGEEFDPGTIGKVMGLYISGTGLGGMAGRIFAGVLTDLFSWRAALAIIGIGTILLSIVFWKMLPEPRHNNKRKFVFHTMWPAYKHHLVNKKLMANIMIAFVLMGSFVTLFNYFGFHLMEPPYNLSQTFVGLIFTANLWGSFSSVYLGNKADKYGNFAMLLLSIVLFITGAVLTLIDSIVMKIVGISVFTFGFFGAHAIASAWIGERTTAFKAQASSLYLLFYYLGSSIVGSSGGLFWAKFNWEGVVFLVVALLAISIPMIIYTNEKQEKAAVESKVEVK